MKSLTFKNLLTQNLVQWIRNNWRSYYNVRNIGPKDRKKSQIDTAWMIMKDRISKDVDLMIREAGGTEVPTRRERFKYRTPAANRVLAILHTDELAKIDKIIETGDVTIPKVIQQQ
jgi:hypothetical protein